MFRLAHITDPHVGPLPRPRLYQLLNKRITGYVNWRRNRGASHDMTLLGGLVADLRQVAPDHIACTGDLCNLGLPSEWESSRIFLDGLGSPEDVSFVPGNHDAYIDGSLEGLLRACAPFTKGDDGEVCRFPYLRRRGRIALIGLSSAIPTLPFVASGRLGRRQTAAAEELLADLGREGLYRIVMIHHPPHAGGAAPGRNLTDAPRLEAMLTRVGAELVIHGHNHVGSVAFLRGPGHGQIPVIGAPSASARGGAIIHRAGYHLYTIDADETGFLLTAQLRGLKPDGTIGDAGMISLGRDRAA
jgi:3',5'-cyclic AMP phosphodiesterase CpdA